MTQKYIRKNVQAYPITKRYNPDTLALIYKFATEKMKLYGSKPDPWLTGKLIKKGEGKYKYGKRYDKNKYDFFFLIMRLATYDDDLDGPEGFELNLRRLIALKDAFTFGSTKGHPAAFRHTKTFVNRLLQINKPGPKPDSVREQAVEFVLRTGPSCGWGWRCIYEAVLDARVQSPWPQSWEKTNESTIKSFITRCKNHIYTHAHSPNTSMSCKLFVDAMCMCASDFR